MTTQNMTQDAEELSGVKRLLCDLFDRLHACALRITGNSSDAEDLAQQTMLRVLNRKSANEVTEGYIFRVMQNLWVDELRKRPRRPSLCENINQLDETAIESDPSGPLMQKDVLGFPQFLRASLAGQGKHRLARLVEAIINVGMDRDQIALELELASSRSVDAYIHELRQWCLKNQINIWHCGCGQLLSHADVLELLERLRSKLFAVAEDDGAGITLRNHRRNRTRNAVQFTARRCHRPVGVRNRMRSVLRRLHWP